MHRIDSSTAEVDKFGAGKNGFTEGTPGVTPATETTDDWFDGVQEEICNVIEGNGGTLVKGTRNQLLGILRNLVGATSSGVGLKATGGTPNGNGLEGVGTGTGTGVDGTATDGYGVKAESDTSSPAKAALRVVPQDNEPSSSPQKGDIFIHSTNGKPRIHDGAVFQRPVMQAYAAPDRSSVITNTTTPTNFDNTYDIPANTLQVGDVIHLKAAAVVLGYTGTPTLTLTLKLDANTVLSHGFTVDGTQDVIEFEATIRVQAIGASGDLDCYGKVAKIDSVTQAVVWAGDLVNLSAVDTTQALTASLQATWSVASTSNQVRMDHFIIEIQ